jgi:hypothetical protein
MESIEQARVDYMAEYPHRALDVLYVMSNAKPAWIAAFSERMRAEGWEIVIGSSDLVLNMQQTEVSMAVDMEIARRAEVFVGNGVSERA